MKKLLVCLAFTCFFSSCKKEIDVDPAPKYSWLPFTSKMNNIYKWIRTPANGGTGVTSDKNVYVDESTLSFGQCLVKVVNSNSLTVRMGNITETIFYNQGQSQAYQVSSTNTTSGQIVATQSAPTNISMEGKSYSGNSVVVKLLQNGNTIPLSQVELFISENKGLVYVYQYSSGTSGIHKSDSYILK